MFYTQLVHFGDGEVYVIGGAGFETEQERLESWSSIPALEPELRSIFRVEMVDADDVIQGEKDVTLETAITLLGSEYELVQAVENAKKKLADEVTCWRSCKS